MKQHTRFADAIDGVLDDIVDLDRYPIDKRYEPELQALINSCRASLDADGLLTLGQFLRPEALAAARRELADLARTAIRRDETSSAYARSDVEQDLSPSDPRTIMLQRSVGHVTRDQIPPQAVVARLYAAPAFKSFIAACLGVSRVFEYADPLAGLVATVLAPGDLLGWHYDTNEYVVSLMTQAPERGGEFQFCPNLRSPGNENLQGLKRVLTGKADELVSSRHLVPGDLQVFLGRYSLHQVARVRGRRDRHVVIFSYSNRPGVIGPVDRTRAVYGRVTEAHLVAEEFPTRVPDGLIL